MFNYLKNKFSVGMPSLMAIANLGIKQAKNSNQMCLGVY